MTALAGERLAPGVGRGAAVVGIAALLGVGAVVSPSYALAAVVGLGFVLAAFNSLAVGCAIFALLTFFGQLGSGGEIKAAGAVLVLAWLVRVARDRATPFVLRSHPVVGFAAVAFVVLGAASALWAESPGAAISASSRVALGVVLVFVLFAAVDTKRRLQYVLGGLLAGAFVSALVGLASGTPTEAATATVEDANRLAGQVGDANTFAAILIPSLMISAFWAGVTRSAIGRLLLTSGALVFAVALFLTGSRGGLVALGICFVAILFLGGPVRARAIAVMAVVAAIAVVYYSFFAPTQALSRITHFAAGGGAGRTDLWSVAVNIFEHHPVLGIGEGNFQIVEAHYAFGTINLPRVDLIIDTPKVAHNTYLQVLTELGVVGFVAFLLVAAGTVLIAWRAARTAAEAGELELEVIARGTLIGTLGMLGAIVFFTAHTEKELWFVFGVTLALSTLASRAAKARAVASYDRAVEEEFEGGLERRLDERVDALLAEQERLTRRRTQIAELERRLNERERSLDSGEVARREQAVEARTQELDERERLIALRETEGLELARAIIRDRRELEEERRTLAAAPPDGDGPVAGLESQVARLAEELEAERRRVPELEAQVAQLRDEYAAVREQLTQKRQGETELEAEVAQLRDELREERRLRPELEAQAARLREEHASLSEQLERERARTPELEAQVAQLRSELAALRDQLEQERARAVPAVPTAAPAAGDVADEPEAKAVEVPASTAGWMSLPQLEELVARAAPDHPERLEDWNTYLFFLRDYVQPDGSLPASFDALVDDVFGDLVSR